jgi:stage II sporulation protein E
MENGGEFALELGFIGQSQQIGKNERIKKLFGKVRTSLNIKRIIYYITIYFISGAKIFGGMIPFGAALFATEYREQLPYTAGIIIVLATVFPHFSAVLTLKYASALVLFTAAASKISIKNSPVKKGIVMGAAVMSAGVLPKILGGLLFYDIMLLLLEGVIVFAAVNFFSRAKTVIFCGSGREVWATNDIVSVAVFFGAAIIGAGGITVYGISISTSLCVLAALCFAYGNGAVAGAAAGVALGLVTGLYNNDLATFISIFALSSMAAGFFGKYGKTASAIAFLFADSVIMFYKGTSYDIFYNFAEVAVAVMVFTVVPKKVISYFSVFSGERKNTYTSRIKEYTSRKIYDSAKSLTEVAGVFERIIENKLLGTESAASSFFEKTARKLCEKCQRTGYCWRKEFHRTYTSLFVMLEICEKKGFIRAEDIPEDMMKKCRNKDKIVDIFNAMYEVFKVDRLWETRVNESRIILAKQLHLVSEQLKNLSKTARRGVAFNTAVENSLTVALSEKGVPVTGVSVISGIRNSFTAEITFREDYEYTELIAKTAGEIMDCDVMCTRTTKNSMTLIPAPALRVTTGVISEAKEQNPVNGDTADLISIDTGEVVLVISDGMGNGEKARDDSRAAIDILRGMQKGGFDIESTIDMINSVLVLKSAETSFATIDLAFIDTRHREAEFFKLGAVSSFIKRDDCVKTIKASALPAGVFANVEPDREKVKLRGGDFIVLLSDGVLNLRTEKAITDLISAYKGNNPAELAEKILKAAKHLIANIVNDDMTVLAAYIDEEISV